MGFILAEKAPGASKFGGCDGMVDSCVAPDAAALDAALGDAQGGAGDGAEPELPLAPLLVALLLATLAVWVAAGAVQCLLSRLLPSKRMRRLRHWPRHHRHGAGAPRNGDGDGVDDDSSAAPLDSPPTPPPTTWLRDADGAAIGAGYFNSAGRAGGRSVLAGGGVAGGGAAAAAGLASPQERYQANGYYAGSHYSTPGSNMEPLLFGVGGPTSYGGGTPYTGTPYTGTPYTGGCGGYDANGTGYNTGGGAAAGTGGGRAYGLTPASGGAGGLRLRSAAQRRERRAAAEMAAAAAAGIQQQRRRGGLVDWFVRFRRRRDDTTHGDGHNEGYGLSGDGPSTSYGTGAAATGEAAAGGGGWDPALLARQAALLPAISSVEGLVASKEFQEHMRATRRRSPLLERQQAAARLGLYGHLRRMDPEAFRRLLSRSDLRAYDSRPAPLPLLLAEYLVSGLAVPAALAALAAGALGPVPAAVRYGAVAGWLALRLWLAAGGQVSPLGRLCSAYLVYDDVGPQHEQLYGNGWACLAGLGSHLALSVVEVCLAAGSLGLLVPVSVLSLVLGGGGLRRGAGGGEAEEVRPRQTLAMRLLRVRMEVEVSRPIALSPYSPSTDPTAASGASPLPTPLPFGFGYGLGGSSDAGGSLDDFGFGSAQASPRAPPGSVPAQTRYGRLAPPHWFR